MKPVQHIFQDKDIEKIMGKLLQYGVLISAVIVMIGAFFYLYQHGSELPQYQKFNGEPNGLIQLKLVLENSLKGNGRAIIQAGLFVLIATPIARIIFSIGGYIMEKDFRYIIIASIVLFIILYNLF